ncbi:MAG: ankyrin repeat domain-containing protein [Hyphomonadaceae bacterium]|nr:ankyrin repeat domain-containing protein [Hyphomonadaceae bacterium]
MTDATRERHLPVHPDLGQLKRQAKELLRGFRAGDPDAVADFAEFHPEKVDATAAKLADAQLVLARAHGATGWPRIVQSCQIVDAIWKDDIATVRRLVTAHPNLLHEEALVRPPGRISNWGPPMTYAANVGRDRIIEMLHAMGAKDHQRAIGRAVLQSKIGTAKILHAMAGNPPPPADELGGPAYTLSASGTAFVFEIGGRAVDEAGRRLAPVDVVLETDSRKPLAKHAILEMYVQHGLELLDTPVMALHRGRIDLLEKHLNADPGMLSRQFRWEEIYPPEMGCHDEVLATHGTPLRGATLLHMCCDYDELDIAEWLIARGADANAKAAVDADGFGGHTPLFNAVVSQHHFWMNHSNGPPSTDFAKLLLEHGADPNVRASLRKQMHPGYGPDTLREYRDVTPLSWGRRFHFRKIVSEPAIRLIEAAGGVE